MKNKFQLLGITSLFVAAKIEVNPFLRYYPSLFMALQEIYPPRLMDFSYVTDNTFSEDDILNMELDLMNVRQRRRMGIDEMVLIFRH